MARRSLSLALAVGLLTAACGSADGAEPASASSEIPAVGGQVSTAQTAIGEVLVDATGLTLYGFLDDVEGVSTCFDTCATAWPPVAGNMAVVAALDSSGFDAISRPDGTDQLRVAGRWPLYTFAGDAGPGDINGQESGGVWFAIAPDGSLIGLDGAAPNEEAVQGAVESEPDDVPGPVDGVETDLGLVMTAANGLTVYAFANDPSGASNCNEPCSDTWPPVSIIADVAPQLAGLEIIVRQDGTDQVTLNGTPLYTYIDDEKTGDIGGQEIGDVWFAVSAEGEVLTPPAVRVGSTDSGDVLINDDGFALYTFANDDPNTSNCSAPCSDTWPPVSGDTRIDGSLEPGQFGQISRDDGTTQLTLHGHPLYTFTGDTNPGDTNGTAVGTPGTWSIIAATDIVANPDSGSASSTAGAAATVQDADVITGMTSIGDVLTTADGLTLYAFLNDSATESACNDACADAWPPIPGGMSFAAGIDVTVTDIERADGSPQTVVGNWPVYTFAGDAGPGEVSGQGSGDVWFAIAPDGSLIR